MTPLVVAHSILDIVSFVGYALLRPYLHRWFPRSRPVTFGSRPAAPAVPAAKVAGIVSQQGLLPERIISNAVSHAVAPGGAGALGEAWRDEQQLRRGRSSAVATTAWWRPPIWLRAGQRVARARTAPRSSAVPPSPSSPFGPDYTVTSLSYVVSLAARRQMVRDLDLVRYGYHVYPQGPYFAPYRRTGATSQLPERSSGSPASQHRQLLRSTTPTPYDRLGCLARTASADVLGPLLHSHPSQARHARSPQDLFATRPRLAWQLKGLGRAGRRTTSPGSSRSASPISWRSYFESDADARRPVGVRRHRHVGRASQRPARRS